MKQKYGNNKKQKIKIFINEKYCKNPLCSRNGQSLELSEFSIDNSRKDGHHVNCKECRKLEYKSNKEHKLKYQKEYYNNNKEKRYDLSIKK
jgi:hypothetical protein